MNVSLLIQWNDVNTLGIPILDEQHRGIVSVINTLDIFIRQNKAEFFLGTLFTMMDCYTKVHFATEEELLRLAGYPLLDCHRKLHGDLIRESFSLANQSLRLGEPKVYLHFLKNWWVNHINQCDREYVPIVREYLALQAQPG